MPTVREEMARHGEEMEAGTVRPRGGVLVEALFADAEPLLKRSQDDTPRTWTTQRIDTRALEESAAKRIERMMALQDLVSDDSQVFDLKKRGHNDSANICIGRARRNDVVIDDDTVSSQHAIIEEGRGGFLLEDNRSSNGTYVNRQAVELRQQVLLQSGDCLSFGGCSFYYLTGSQFALFLKLRLQLDHD